MSDTITLKTLCDHKRADPHYIELGNRVCSGGRERTFQRTWTLELDDDGHVGDDPLEAWVEVDDDE